MKKAVFFFDTFLIKKENDYYGMTLTSDFLNDRYLKYFDELTISTRVKDYSKEGENYNGYKRVNDKRIIVSPVLSYKKIPDAFLKRKRIYTEIENILDGKDVAIIRLPSMIGNIACEVCRKKGVDYLVEMVACAWDGYVNHHNKFGKLIAPYMFFETRRQVKKSKKVLYVTEKFLQKRYPTTGKSTSCSDVILNPIDNNIIKLRINKINTMNFNNEIRIVTLANVGLKYKGQEYVIKALNLTKNKNIKYYLIGNGNAEYLKKIINKYNLKDRVIFLGSIPHEKVFDVLTEMDIYIQPSLQEGMPRALLEAMSVGLPCYGSNAGGIPELLDNEYIFNKKDYKKIAEIFDNLNSDVLLKNSRNVLKKVENYNPELLTERRMGFYKGR